MLDRGGVLASSPADTARFDHDPVGHALRGLLIEPAATNLLTAADPGQPFDLTENCAVDPAGPVAPDGIGQWLRIVPMPGPEVGYAAHTGFGKSPAATYCFSLYARAAGVRWLLMSGDFQEFSNYAWFDLATGTIGQKDGASSAVIEPAGPGSWRLSLGFSGTSGNYCAVAPVNEDGAFEGGYASGSATLVWRPVLEAGPTATSVLPLGTAATTRAADALTLAWGSRGVADGAAGVRYTFDDGSSQDVATTIAGGEASVPTTLDRRRLRRAAII